MTDARQALYDTINADEAWADNVRQSVTEDRADLCSQLNYNVEKLCVIGPAVIDVNLTGTQTFHVTIFTYEITPFTIGGEDDLHTAFYNLLIDAGASEIQYYEPHTILNSFERVRARIQWIAIFELS